MPQFQKGQSGNPSGAANREERASIKRAFVRILSAKPWLLETAIENGLQGRSPLGYLELAARLMKEIGVQGESTPQIAIIFNSPLDSSKLKEGSEPVRVIARSNPKKLAAHLEPTELIAPIVEPDMSALENESE